MIGIIYVVAVIGVALFTKPAPRVRWWEDK